MVEGAGFEPAKLSRQIYSLIPLATREPLPDKLAKRQARKNLSGAGGRNRTPDLLITSQLLYQLSYASSHSPHQRGRYTTDFYLALQYPYRVPVR